MNECKYGETNKTYVGTTSTSQTNAVRSDVILIVDMQNNDILKIRCEKLKMTARSTIPHHLYASLQFHEGTSAKPLNSVKE